MTENSFLMIHRPWSQAVGNSEELEATADLLDKMEDKLLDIYVNAVEKRSVGTEMNLRKKINLSFLPFSSFFRYWLIKFHIRRLLHNHFVKILEEPWT